MEFKCTHCGKSVPANEDFCDYCGSRLEPPPPPLPDDIYNQSYGTPGYAQSGYYQGRPAETHGFSWGAYGVPTVWSFAMNQVGYGVTMAILSVLLLVPFLNVLIFIPYLVIAIVLGFKGYEMAWNSRGWDSPQQFADTQKVWNIAGIATSILIAIFLILSFSLNMALLTKMLNNDSIFGEDFASPSRANDMYQNTSIKLVGSSLQLEIDMSSSMNSSYPVSTSYPTNINSLIQKLDADMRKNVITNTDVKVVAFDQFSPGDCSYLYSTNSPPDNFLLVMHRAKELKPGQKNSGYFSYYGSYKVVNDNRMLCAFTSMMDFGNSGKFRSGTYKDSVSNKVYNVKAINSEELEITE